MAQAPKAAAAKLKRAGQSELRKEINKALKETAEDLRTTTRAVARRRLPQRGGFAERVAKAPQRVSVTSKSVRIVVGKKGSGARAADEGLIRHPVFGRRQFVSQRVIPGWFTDTAESQKSEIVDAIGEAMENVARKVTG